jgi:hypothetical protein
VCCNKPLLHKVRSSFSRFRAFPRTPISTYSCCYLPGDSPPTCPSRTTSRSSLHQEQNNTAYRSYCYPYRRLASGSPLICPKPHDLEELHPSGAVQHRVPQVPPSVPPLGFRVATNLPKPQDLEESVPQEECNADLST